MAIVKGARRVSCPVETDGPTDLGPVAQLSLSSGRLHASTSPRTPAPCGLEEGGR